MSTLDDYVYTESTGGMNSKEYIAQDKQFMPSQDKNQGSYPSQQIIFESVPDENFDSFSENFLVIPLTMEMKANNNSFHATDGVAGNDFALSLKNGIQHIIDNVAISLNTQTINSVASSANLEMSWRLLQMSADERETFQDSINFCMDTSDSIRYNSTTIGSTVFGLGETNNVLKTADFDTVGGWGNATSMANKGRLTRMKSTSCNPDRATNISYFVSSSKVHEGWTSGVTVNTNTQVTYEIFAYIPLPLIHSIFSALPLCRGLKLKLTMNMNTGCSCTLVNDATKFVKAGSSVNTPHGVLPFMISPVGGGFYPGTATSVTCTLKIQNSLMNSCEMYNCKYSLDSEKEKAYLANPFKNVVFNDYIVAIKNNVAAGEGVNHSLTNALSKIRYLLMMPSISQTANDAAGWTPANSPFSSAPATSAPYAKVSNFQIQLNTANVFKNPHKYTFETFIEQVRPALSVNGGSLNSMGLSSGCLSKDMWEKAYGAYYIDLSRTASKAIDEDSRSVTVFFKNDANVMMDYTFIIGFEKSFSMNVGNGQFVAP